MINMTYDPEADAAYISIGDGDIARTEDIGRFICDLDAKGRVVGIEILSASKVLAPGAWKKAKSPRSKAADAAE